MDSPTTAGLLAKGAYAIAVAAVLGGGSTLIGVKLENTTQNGELVMLRRDVDELRAFRGELADARTDMAILTDRLEQLKEQLADD